MISRFLAPKEFRPSTIDEWEKMQRLDMERFKTLNEAGGTNPTYLWVEAIIRLQRPFVVSVTLATWAACHLLMLAGPLGLSLAPAFSSFVTGVDNAAAIVSFYLFGERTMLGSTTAGSSGLTPLTATQDAARSVMPTPVAGVAVLGRK